MEAAEDDSGAWIKKRVDPSSVDDEFKDGYVDMLADNRAPSLFNDISWAMKKIPKTATYKYKHERSYEQLNKDVLHSDRVSYVIEQICKESKTSKAEVFQEADKILTAMAHRFNMASVRALGYPLIKVFKRLHDHIYVNTQGLSMVNDLVQEYPVLLVPSHRSYFDFIILSVMCFHYDLPLPAIVAAQDFMGMFMIGTMLRNSGAFYIKRSFRSDKLYWAIFTEYVQTQLYNGDHPIEFFVEGTRSRTQKCYAPKLGMLAGSLEAYFKGLVPDIMIVPISISYDRVLEENLFAQELLGIPKPKESTSKLFKVFSILNENYGSIHVTICPPISTRKMATSKINRLPHSLEPRFMSNITEEEEKLVGEIGYAVLWQTQKCMVLSVWSLIAAVLLQNRQGISVSDLTETVRWLKRHANNVGAYIDWPGNMTDGEVILSSLKSRKGFVNLVDDFVTIAAVDHGERLSQSKNISGETIADAATHMVLVIYRNQMVHAFVPYSLLSMIVIKCGSKRETLSRGEAFRLFSFAVKLFANEFILDQNSIPEIFDNAMKVLEHTSDIVTDSTGAITLKQSVTRFTTFLSNMLLPFVTGYWALCKYISHTTVDMGIGKEPVVRPKHLVLSTQYFILALINSGDINDFELLNLDMLNNALISLKLFKVVYNEVRNGEKFVAARIASLTKVVEELESIAVLPSIPEVHLHQSAVSAALKAKL